MVVVRLQKQAQAHRHYYAQKPWWRRPLAGYLLSIPIVGVALLGVVFGQRLLPSPSFPSSYMLIAVLLVALCWGFGPALLTILLGALALDYFYLIPPQQFTIHTWNGFVQLLPYVISGLIIAMITSQRESARVKALLAEQEAQEQAAELAQLNQQLEEADRLKDQFLSMASHELRTPITSIRGQAQIAHRRLAKQQTIAPGMESTLVALEKIDEQTRRLNALVDDLLTLSSLRSGKVDLHLDCCNLGEVCKSVVEDQRLLTGRTIELDLPPEPFEIRADCDRLSQVVVNLVTNALKYSPDDTPVRVSVYREDDHVCLQVSDAGPGIPAEEQKRIFETFYRSPTAQSSAQPGFGLGLAICADIVERHGGRIWCESQVGKGSTFVVELAGK